jgi:hypothetical protein
MRLMTKQSVRYANISIGVGVLIVVVGVLVFRKYGDAALELVGLATLPGSLGTYFMLEERARRRGKRESQ